MIHFDTNALIALPLWAREHHPVVRRVLEGEPAAVSTMVWYEFLIGPVEQEEIDLARTVTQGRVVTLADADAVLAATLFNTAGRKRMLKTDALIAAAAIRADAAFVTINVSDFEPFVTHGLRLVPATV